jgi:hypothetical protein
MEKNKNLTLDQDLWKEGFRAGEEGKASCPYPTRSREAWSWQSGFVEGIARSVRNLKPEADSPTTRRDLADPEAAVRQARAKLVAVRTGLINCARDLAKPMGERLKNCDAAQVKESMVDGLSIEEQKVIGPLLKSVEEINKQIGVYDRRIEENLKP